MSNDEQVQRYVMEHAEVVAKNVVESWPVALTYALTELAEKDCASDLHQLLTDSAVELMEEGL